MWRASDLALDRDPSSRFLTGLLAVMVFLAALAVSGAISARSFVGDWSAALGDHITVQIPPTGDPAADDRLERRDAVLRLLRVTPGVRTATPLGDEEAAALVRPWLGDEMLQSLPLPILVDVRLDPAQPLDLAALRTRLENAAPGTVLDDHDKWVGDARALATSVAAAALLVLALVIGAAVLAVVFAVRTGVAIHRGEIQILTLIGAPDRYIARQFEGQAARSALKGGVVGAILAAFTLMGIAWVTGDDPVAGGITGEGFAAVVLRGLETAWVLAPGLVHWVVLVLAPVGAIAIAILAARVSVHRALAKAP